MMASFVEEDERGEVVDEGLGLISTSAVDGSSFIEEEEEERGEEVEDGDEDFAWISSSCFEWPVQKEIVLSRFSEEEDEEEDEEGFRWVSKYLEEEDEDAEGLGWISTSGLSWVAIESPRIASKRCVYLRVAEEEVIVRIGTKL